MDEVENRAGKTTCMYGIINTKQIPSQASGLDLLLLMVLVERAQLHVIPEKNKQKVEKCKNGYYK